MQIMYQLGCFRFGKYASSQATYSSAVMFPSVHSSRIVRALYFQVLNSFSLSCLERTPDLHLATEAKGIDNGFEEQIKEFYEKYSDTKLIIIDVLQRVRELGGKDYSYASDYEIISKLKKLIDGTGIALLIVHHTRKQQSDDIFDMISGTNGLMGAADGAFIISKEKRTGDGAVIDLVGRDQPDQNCI